MQPETEEQDAPIVVGDEIDQEFYDEIGGEG